MNKKMYGAVGATAMVVCGLAIALADPPNTRPSPAKSAALQKAVDEFARATNQPDVAKTPDQKNVWSIPAIVKSEATPVQKVELGHHHPRPGGGYPYPVPYPVPPPGPVYPPPGDPGHAIVFCGSENYQPATCNTWMRNARVYLRNQVSKSSCDGQWRWDGSYIYVYNGCRADFEVFAY